MKKKKHVSRQQKITPTVVNLEIDYDKLAQAIVRAQNKSKSSPKNVHWRKRLFQYVNGISYLLFAFASLYPIKLIWTNYQNKTNASLWSCIVGTVVCVILALGFFACQQETLDDDYDATINQFNTIIALVALIVSIIALVKGGS